MVYSGMRVMGCPCLVSLCSLDKWLTSGWLYFLATSTILMETLGSNANGMELMMLLLLEAMFAVWGIVGETSSRGRVNRVEHSYYCRVPKGEEALVLEVNSCIHPGR